MNGRDFVKEVFKTVWGSNTRPKHYMMDELIEGLYTYEETIEKIKEWQSLSDQKTCVTCDGKISLTIFEQCDECINSNE